MISAFREMTMSDDNKELSPTHKIHIRNNETGETRIRYQDYPWWESSHFSWTQNNFRCDCNRAEVFHGDEYTEDEYCDDEHPINKCGHTRFTVTHAEMEDGTIIPIDTPEQTREAPE